MNPFCYTASNSPCRKRHSLLLVGMLLIGFALLIAGCDENFLEPKPMSFLSPENTFTKKAGLEGVLANSNVTIARQWYGGNAPIMTEYGFVDISVRGNPEPDRPHNLVTQITPTTDGQSFVHGYWNTAYNGVTYGNIIIANVENVTDWSSEQEKNAMLAAGFFHRAYWYYRLTQQFGDVPVYLAPIEEPRLDFNTYSREAILKVIRDDLEFAVQHLPQTAENGNVNRAAGYYLLTKVYLALRQFQDAVDAASEVIDGGRYALMTDRFGNGPFADDARFDVMWDLHQKENIASSANSEAIYVTQDRFGIEGNLGGTARMRDATPCWWWHPVDTPTGAQGTTDGPEGNPLSDSLGRGIARIRTVPYYNYKLWKKSGEEDLRHSDVNWFAIDEFWYNNPDAGEYYGEPFVRGAVRETTRTWFPFPYNKLYIRDEISQHRKDGGHSDQYIYRLAGLYLLRAEAYYWMGNVGQAAEDINAVRERAGAEPITAGDVTIDYIFDERARELYLETPRKTEMARVAYIMAQLGRNGYSLENMHQDNWYYDRVMDTNVYFREEVTYGANPYIMRPYHVYWPIPQDEIDSNVEGHINQTPGYTGWESNVEPLGYEAIQELPRGSEGGGAAGESS